MAIRIVCRDCEIGSDVGADGLCWSCERHVEDGHQPTKYTSITTDLTGQRHITWWYCHGAGPFGINVERLSWHGVIGVHL